MNIKKKSTRSKLYFGLIVLVLYLITGFYDFNIVVNSFSAFLNLLERLIPIFILVFGLMALSNLIIKPDKISKHLGDEAGLKGWIISISAGIFSTGPIFMWFKLLEKMRKMGMRTSFAAAFLYNRAIKPALIPLLIFYFGWKFTVVLTIYMIIFAVINSLIVEKFCRGEK
ncbi:MAG: hypothetical protein R6U26_03905 [Candidatus Undinarchaeales archaeon]